MKRLALLIPLLFCGCGAIAGQMPDGTRFAAVTLFKDPTFKGLHYATTQATFDLGDYNSATKITGAELGSLIATAAKIFLAIP